MTDMWCMSKWQLVLEEENTKPQGILRIKKWADASELILWEGGIRKVGDWQNYNR